MSESTIVPPAMTRHAQRRWDERCAGLHLMTEWVNARRLGKKIKKKLIMPMQRKSTTDNGRYYLKSPGGAVFVVAKSVVVTVMHVDSMDRPE